MYKKNGAHKSPLLNLYKNKKEKRDHFFGPSPAL